MKQRGYFLIGDSANDGVFTDLTFKRPLIEGDKEIRVESKFTDLSLKDKDFLHGMGIYFNIFNKSSQGFSLFVFVRKCKSPSQWKQIFDDAKSNEKEVGELRKDILKNLEGKEKEEFESVDITKFKEFLYEVTLIQGDYPALLQSIDEMKKTEKFNINKSLLDESHKVIKKEEVITSNLLTVISMPIDIWSADIKKEILSEEMIGMGIDKQIYINRGKVYSFKNMEEDGELLRYLRNVSRSKVSELNLEESKKNNLFKILIKSYVISKGRKIGLAYDNLSDTLYFTYKGLKYNAKYRGRRLFKPYFGEDKKTLRFVKHDGVSISVKAYGQKYYVCFKQKLIFSKDGKKDIIRGNSASGLHHKFTQKFSYNNTEKSKLLYWIDIFQFKDSGLMNKNLMSISEPLILKASVTFQGGEKFDADLLDYLKEDENEV